jgi:hypothetical protein
MYPMHPMYQALADLVLVTHFAVALFVVGGLGAIVLGGVLGWRWSASLVFRGAHLAAISFVVAQAWLGETCPLTTLESWLRTQAGTPGYSKGFIEHWVTAALFYSAPTWVFTAVYSAFGCAVLAAWFYFPPVWRKGNSHTR